MQKYIEMQLFICYNLEKKLFYSGDTDENNRYRAYKKVNTVYPAAWFFVASSGMCLHHPK